MLTKRSQIEDRLKESADTEYWDSLYSQMKYAFGEPWEGRSGGGSGVIPYYDPVKLYTKRVGRSMKIMQHALIMMSKVLAGEPEPWWPQVHRYISEARKQVYISRYRKCGWKQEFEKQYLDMVNLGLGILQWGLKTERDGYTYATCQHIPLIHVLKDPHEPDPSKWRYIGFVKYMAPEDAIALYGNRKKIEDAVVTVDGGSLRKVVRVIEYYDLGFGEGDPTQAVILGDVGGDYLVPPEPNDYVDTLPFSYGENVMLPFFKHHVGNIILQMGTQEMRNKLERSLAAAAMDIGMDLVNTDRVDKNEYQKARREGRTYVYAKSGIPGDNNPAIDRVPPKEASRTVFELVNLMDRELSAESGITDLDRGSQLQSQRTLGEVQLLDERSQTSKARIARQTSNMIVNAVKVWQKYAMLYDDAPCKVDVFGNNMTFNDKADPTSKLYHLFEEESNVVVSTMALTMQDELGKQQLRLQQLGLLMGDPMVNQQKVTEEKVRAIGEDPAEYVLSAPPMPMDQGMQSGAQAPNGALSPKGAPAQTQSGTPVP